MHADLDEVEPKFADLSHHSFRNYHLNPPCGRPKARLDRARIGAFWSESLVWTAPSTQVSQTIHLGLKGLWVLIDWWAYGDVLMHRHLHAPVTDPGALQDVSTEGFGPCVWELTVQAHERRASLEHMLARPQGPDLQAYLDDGLTAVV